MSSKKAASATATKANAASPSTTSKPAKASDDAADADAGDEEEFEKGAAGKASKDMAAVTGFMGEESGANVDSKALGQAMNAITDAKAASTARKARERELEKVAVSKEDLELVMSELDLPKQQADRLLREANGSLETVLRNVLTVSQ